MKKRKIILGTYDTAIHGWTLTGWALSRAEQKTKYLDRPNGDGSWDLSTALTDGIIKYKDRSFTATLECSDGTRMEREDLIRRLINSLDGEKVEIRLPDDDAHHLVGRLQITRDYNDPAHARVTVAALCEPWKYADAETVVVVTANTAVKQFVTLHNRGKRAVVPEITVTEGEVLLEYGTASMAMSPGVYKWPTILLTPGSLPVRYSGTGTVMFTYREAVLE